MDVHYEFCGLSQHTYTHHTHCYSYKSVSLTQIVLLWQLMFHLLWQMRLATLQFKLKSSSLRSGWANHSCLSGSIWWLTEITHSMTLIGCCIRSAGLSSDVAGWWDSDQTVKPCSAECSKILLLPWLLLFVFWNMVQCNSSKFLTRLPFFPGLKQTNLRPNLDVLLRATSHVCCFG